MSHRATYWAFEQELVPSANHKLVLILLADWADERGIAWPKQQTIADKALLTTRTVRTILADLERVGCIERVPTRRRDGRRGVDNYVLKLNN